MEERIKDNCNEVSYIHANMGELTEIKSMCPKCEQDGMTKLLMTEIPHFREIIISSFECGNADCGEMNREIQFGGKFYEKHVEYMVKVERCVDLNRQVVKSEYATVIISELELEIPPQTKKGQLTTIEGLLRACHDDLQMEQVVVVLLNPDLANKIDEFCLKILKYINLEASFTLRLTDPSGNSYIEALYDYYHPTIDPLLTKIERVRTSDEMTFLGLAVESSTDTKFKRTEEEEQVVEVGAYNDQFHMQQCCPACNDENGELRTHKCNIPYFKETLIMCFVCEKCNYKNTEIKNGGAISPFGLRITITVNSIDDFSRDILKSDTAMVRIPELELELAPGTLGSFFTTIEGILSQIHNRLDTMCQLDFTDGDSQVLHHGEVKSTKSKRKFSHFMEQLKEMMEGEVFPIYISIR